jgi:hypothetical protein
MLARLVTLLLVAVVSVALIGATVLGQATPQPAMTLVETVRQATEPYQDVAAATDAGYLQMSCVSGPEFGAMGVHYVNPDLLGDGMLDAAQPEALVYEPTGEGMSFVAVEYIVISEAWHAANEAPPVLMGQHFHLVGSPNRYGLPAFYELHVWAGKENPNGTFADWNPTVKCDEFVPDGAMGAGQ